MRPALTEFMALRCLITLVLPVCFAIQAAGSAVHSTDSVRPNVILILTDDQGYGDISAHGNPILKTPHLDQLRSESVRFTDFHVSPTCSPTRAALLTGRHEFFSGVTHTILERERLSLDSITLPRVLQKSGYATGIFGKWHLGDEDAYLPGRRGFEEVFIHGAGGIGQSYSGSCGDAPGNSYFDPVLWYNDRFVKTEGFCTDIFFQRATAWIDQQLRQKRPFFAYIATNAPHSPYTARPQDAALYANSVSDQKTAHFYGMIHNIDENIGRLLQQLKDWQVEEQTLVVFMNDNGTAAGQQVFNAGMRGAKGTAWMGGTRANSFWRWPQILQPGDRSELAAHIDFFPTIAEITGTDLDSATKAELQGRSLLPVLKKSEAPWEERNLFTHVGRWPKLSNPNDFKFRMAAVRNGRWSLISPDGGATPKWQLFDLGSDPGQRLNVIADHPDVAGRLTQAFDAWWDDVQEHLVNESEVGPKFNSFAVRYWQQFGGQPTLEQYQQMAPLRPWPPTAQPGPLGRWVNPLIGTGGNPLVCGNNFPGATAPFGMVRLSPDTIGQQSGKGNNTSGYFYDDRYVLGFSHTRLVGTGAIDGGAFRVVPAINSEPEHPRQKGARYRFSHEFETAFPGYYAVWLPEPNILAELTSTTRTGLHRYTFPANSTPHVQIHVGSVLGKGRTQEAQVEFSRDRTEILGSVRTFGSFSSRFGGSKIYFVARFNQPVQSHQLWRDDSEFSDQLAAQGDNVGIEVRFATHALPSSLDVRIGLSYVSVENARLNLASEVGDGDFQQVLASTVRQWEEHLGRVQLEGGTDQQRTQFYTALYRALNMPTTFSDVNGQYLGFDQRVHITEGFTYYTDMSLWDTFRTTHPLYTLLYPDRQREMVISLVEMSKQGGYLPRWPSGSGYTNSMFGTPADLVIAETYLKGIQDFDVQTAYQKMKSTALGPPSVGSAFSGRAGIEQYLQYGYCPADLVPKSIAKTLEYCYSDYAIARLAEALGHSDEAADFDQRAGYYRNVWNPETQFFQARDSHGQFQSDFRPLMLTYTDIGGKFTGAYVEGSGLQWRWAVPHDPDGLMALFKSREYFVQQLDEFFSKSHAEVGRLPNAYYWHGNQPDLFAAYLFNFAGRPDLTAKWVRWILDKKYGPEANGLDGNDDGGTLSAWYVFSSLGFYPVAGTPRYTLASPIWKRAELDLGSNRLTIRADEASANAIYPKRITLNSQEISDNTLLHQQLQAGGELRFEMTTSP